MLKLSWIPPVSMSGPAPEVRHIPLSGCSSACGFRRKRKGLPRRQYQGLVINANGDSDLIGAADLHPHNGCFAFELHRLRALEIDRHLDYRVDLKAAICLEVHPGETDVTRGGLDISPTNFDQQILAFAICIALLLCRYAR